MPGPENSTVQGYAGQFYDAAQRHRADSLGMWLFLGTEAMLFGGLFAALMVYRIMHPAEAKEVARHLQIWIAAANTAILLTSSFAMAAANVVIRHGRSRWAGVCLMTTAALGVLFLGLKAVEYAIDIRDHILPGRPVGSHGSTTLFVDLYYAATGIHGLHLAIGIAWIAGLAVAVTRTERSLITPVHLAGLYWHFVDVVWIFLYPALYLAGRSGS